MGHANCVDCIELDELLVKAERRIDELETELIWAYNTTDSGYQFVDTGRGERKRKRSDEIRASRH